LGEFGGVGVDGGVSEAGGGVGGAVLVHGDVGEGALDVVVGGAVAGWLVVEGGVPVAVGVGLAAEEESAGAEGGVDGEVEGVGCGGCSQECQCR